MIIASNNAGKIREAKKILESENIISLKEANVFIDVEEDGKTFYENAHKKAKEIFDIVNTPVFADDSGLCIEALDGFPGVMSHRFLGDATDTERNNYIIEKMKMHTNRKCSFICDIVYIDGEKEIHTVGKIDGVIARNARGTNGFGFDPIFELENGKTMAELTEEEKNELSARSIALMKLKKELGVR